MNSQPVQPATRASWLQHGPWLVALACALLVHLVLVLTVSGLVRPQPARSVRSDAVLGVELLTSNWQQEVLNPRESSGLQASSGADPGNAVAVAEQPESLIQSLSERPPPVAEGAQDAAWTLPADTSTAGLADDGAAEQDGGGTREGVNAEANEAMLARASQEIARAIQRVWKVPPGAPATSRVRLRLELERDGRVRSVEMLEISGNENFDESVRRAMDRMERLSQVQRLPKGLYQKYFRQLVLVFDASRTKRL